MLEFVAGDGSFLVLEFAAMCAGIAGADGFSGQRNRRAPKIDLAPLQRTIEFNGCKAFGHTSLRQLEVDQDIHLDGDRHPV